MSDGFKKNQKKIHIDRKQKLDSLRGSLKGSQKEEALFSAWKAQEKKEAKSKKVEAEYKQAKQKLRETRKQFAKEIVGSFPEADKWLKTKAKKAKEKISTASVNRRRVVTGFVAAVALMFTFSIVTRNDNSSKDDPTTLGVGIDTETQSQPTPELPAVEKSSTDFSLLYPAGIDRDLYEVVLVSPEGAAPAYTYLERIEDDGAVIRVTQQEVPGDFNLEEVAENFQATNTIQIDDNKIKHGYSEKGRIQSLFFVKDDLLVSIRSPLQYPDDVWVNYYLSLEK